MDKQEKNSVLSTVASNDILSDIRCIVCDNTGEELFKVKYQKKNFLVVECLVCKFNFIPFYYRKSIDYTTYKPTEAAQEVGKADIWLKIQRNLLRYKLIKKHTNDKKLYDIGCGFGHFLLTGKQLGYDISGAEMSKANVEFIRNQFNIEVYNGNFLEENEEIKYEIMTMWDVLEHMDEADKILEKVSRMLVFNGYLFIQVPQIDSFIAKILRDKWWSMNLDHVNYFSKKTIKKFYEKYGLKVEHIYSSLELKNVLLNAILPNLRIRKWQSQKVELTYTEKQKKFNKITNKLNYLKKILVFVHNTIYKTLSFFHIGDSMIVVAKNVKTI